MYLWSYLKIQHIQIVAVFHHVNVRFLLLATFINFSHKGVMLFKIANGVC